MTTSDHADDTDAGTPPVESLSYADALTELEDLLAELESSDVDVDHLTRQVARGVQLVRFCRGRLEVVTEEVDGVVAELLAADPANGGAGPADGTADDGDGTADGTADHDDTTAEAR